MAYNAGYQELEQRDSSDNIVKPGVVSKKSAFATSDNAGIYDVIAENLRVLHDEIEAGNLDSIVASIKTMYNDMRTNPNFGSTAATAAAEQALAAAKKATSTLTAIESDMAAATAAATLADNAKTTVVSALSDIHTATDSATNAATTAADSAQIAKNNAATSTDNATATATAVQSVIKYTESAASSEKAATTAATTASNTLTSVVNESKQVEENVKAANESEKKSKASAEESQVYAESAATSENTATSAATAATNALTSVTEKTAMATSAADIAKKWATSNDSPDGTTDADSDTGKTKSSKEWAMVARSKATLAANVSKDVQAAINDAVKILQTSLVSSAKMIFHDDDVTGNSPTISRFITDGGDEYPINLVQIGDKLPTGVQTKFDTSNENIVLGTDNGRETIAYFTDEDGNRHPVYKTEE